MTLLPDPSTQQLLRALRERVDAKIRADLAAEEQAAEALRQRVLSAVRRAIEEARRDDPSCGRVWLFGSLAWGQPSERSDVDLLVEGPEGALARRVEQASGRDVHAIAMAEAPASLRERVLNHGLPL